MARPFSFDNAAFHFVRTDGPPGFLPKYLAVYGAGVIVLAIVSFLALGPLFAAYAEMFAMLAQGASESQIERELNQALLGNLGRIGLGYLLMMLIYAGFWSMMESAVLRRYVREEGFSIGWGADEWRMLAVGLIWMLSFIVGYLAFILGVVILVAPLGATVSDGGGALLGIWMFIVTLTLLFVWLYVAVKLSPAGAMTIRDRKVTFFGAWGASKGRFWPTLGAFLVLGLILYVGVIILYMIGGFTVFGAVFSGLDLSNGEADADQVMAVFTNPAVLIPIALLYFAMLLYQGFWQYAWAGIPSLVAVNDPRTGGMHDAAESF
nr:hypothetical protein [Hyphomonas sp. Mor2]